MRNRIADRVGLRPVVGFLVAPLATPLTFSVIGAIDNGPLRTAAQLPAYLLIYGSFAYVAALTLGVAAYLLCPTGWYRQPMCHLAGGACIGALTSGILFFWGVRWDTAELLSVSTLAGAVSGLCFWAVALWRRQT